MATFRTCQTFSSAVKDCSEGPEITCLKELVLSLDYPVIPTSQFVELDTEAYVGAASSCSLIISMHLKNRRYFTVNKYGANGNYFLI